MSVNLQPRRDLTARQQRAFDWIVAYILANHGWPTVREIGRSTGSTRSAANAGSCILRALCRKGWISRRSDCRRRKNIYRLTAVRLTAVPDQTS
jgi:SOS-response transcriptional repressor LexA